MQKLTIVKIGGNVIDSEKNLSAFLQDFAQLKGAKILVHGGGKLANQLAEKLQIIPQMHQGRRITDAETLKLITMVYAGGINKDIVAKLQALQCNAMGFCGADANIIQGLKRPVKTIDYGFAGDIEADGVDSLLLEQFLKLGLTPVFSAITHNREGQLLNTNADTIASTLAMAMVKAYAVELIFCFEKNGVLTDVNDENSVITKINADKFEHLKAENIIFEGMLPKIENALNAVKRGVKAVVIGASDALLSLTETKAGTRIQ